MRKKAIYVFAVLLVLLAPGAAIAHKASVYAFSEAGKIHVEGYFFDGAPCKGCVVRVSAQKDGDALLEGRTDDLGHIEFKSPGTYPLYFKMDAGQGHAATFVLDEGQDKPMAQIDVIDIQGEKPALSEMGDCSSEMEALVDAAVEARIAPLRAEISRLRKASERPGITEVIGGIGYIFGLAGLWLYFRSKNQDRD